MPGVSRRGAYFFASGLQFRISVIGVAVLTIAD